MSYKLNSSIFNKIVSPVILDIYGEKKEYKSGGEVFSAVFDKRYVVESLRAVGDVIEIELKEEDGISEREDQDWIEEQFERTRVEPNLFDGV